MQTDLIGAADVPAGRRWLRWASVGCEAAVVLAWLLRLLGEQYQVPWLQASEGGLDETFAAAVVGVVVTRAIARRGPRAVGLTALRLTFALVVTVLALLGAEYAARIDYRHAQSSGNARDFITQRGSDVAIRVNNLGFRDRDVPAKTGGRYRIVVVGDSFTWGQGVPENERFSNLLGEFLGSRYEVFNFGIPGNNMPQHLDVLERALAVSPDFVLLQLYINDFETKEMERPHSYPLLPGPLDDRMEQSSLLYDLMQTQWARIQEVLGISEGYVHYMTRNLSDPNSPNAREAFGQLHEFFDRAHAAGVPAGAVLFPETDALGPYGKQYPFGFLHDGVRSACTDAQVPCLDLLPLFSTFRDPRSTWVSPFDAHPNAMVNRRAAYEILRAFGSAWQH